MADSKELRTLIKALKSITNKAKVSISGYFLVKDFLQDIAYFTDPTCIYTPTMPLVLKVSKEFEGFFNHDDIETIENFIADGTVTNECNELLSRIIIVLEDKCLPKLK